MFVLACTLVAFIAGLLLLPTSTLMTFLDFLGWPFTIREGTGSSLASAWWTLCSAQPQPELLCTGNGDMLPSPSLYLEPNNDNTGLINHRGPNWPGRCENPATLWEGVRPGPCGYDNPGTDRVQDHVPVNGGMPPSWPWWLRWYIAINSPSAGNGSS